MTSPAPSPDLQAFVHGLKQAREARNISLNDISDATLIGVQFLEAIEQGRLSILPQTYVRAFIREYAAVVGLDPDETMRNYEAASGARPATGAAEPPSEPAPEKAAYRVEPPKKFNLMNWGGIGIAGIIVVVIAILNLTGKKPEPSSREVPFEQVIRENEMRVLPPQPAAQPAADAPAARADSLVLRGSANDSVWVQVVVDSLQPREYLFRPGSKIAWKAQNRFLVTLGNAGAMTFVLNRKELGTLGRPGTVLRNFELSRATLTKK